MWNAEMSRVQSDVQGKELMYRVESECEESMWTMERTCEECMLHVEGRRQ